MTLHPRNVPTAEDCECGDALRWRGPKLFGRRAWRLECVCGRCGPWRSEPEVKRLPAIPPEREEAEDAPSEGAPDKGME